MTSSNRKFLIFSLQDSLYALNLAQVAEVGDPPQMWPIPLAPSCYSGALNFHGDIVAVMNLALFLDRPESCRPGKIIVLHREVASLAFLVDTVVRIVSEDEVSQGSPRDNRFAVATLGTSAGEAVQLDLEAIVREAENCMQGNQ
ncbi:MAG TPA: chemotaxis protein CheW [Dongiaceae bacterium]|nr:chemotaxis protein CheW [Dongiaceae bacterium]